ncbi:transcriptional regulator domain-containing protein [Marinicauda algicola]|uniref:transcriptional regulator domain-containing protein n=1 Tax=Marinicauda algicola TaxID=2029849 RepID=UPI0019D14558|nr:DUF6499 domain-containing protein [Marinicauda algicola]
MLSIDWRSPAAYEHASTIPAAGFAWEYLRRDGDYHRDFEQINRRKTPRASTLTAFSERWGLRFPARPAAPAGSPIAVLDATPAARRRIADTCFVGH